MTQTSNSKSYYYKSTREALRTILKTEGWKALYKGLGPSLIGVSHVVIQFPIYEHLKKLNFFNGKYDVDLYFMTLL
jgi:solute carrier family 25 folate transporter 32